MKNSTSKPTWEGTLGEPFQGLRRFHFIGVGGIGMSAIAEILLRQGFQVSGSDIRPSPLTDKLKQLGARIEIGHRASNLADCQAVVVSSAIHTENPERSAAVDQGLPLVHRGEMLAELMRCKTGIAVTGTHGKSTVTSMMAVVLTEAGLDPSVVNGAVLKSIGGNARLGNGPLLVAEADESDRSFLRLNPVYAVVTNVDSDHMDIYRDLEDLKGAFKAFVGRLPFYGAVAVCADDPLLTDVVKNVHTRVVTYGLVAKAEFSAENLRFDGFAATYRCTRNGGVLGKVRLRVPGRHNVLNSLAAVGLGIHIGLSFDQVRRGLEEFKGADRRLEWKGEKSGVWVVDDYGHHPTEIRATLEACRSFGRRILVVYQPHRYTRTRHTLEQTVRCFDPADRLYLLDVYSAGESPEQGIDSAALAAAIRAHRSVDYLAAGKDLQNALRKESRPGDLILTLGAGDVWKVGEEFLGDDQY